MEAWTRRRYTEQMDTHYPGASSSTHIDSSMGNTKGLSRVLGTVHSHYFCGGALICALQKQSHQPFWNMQNLPDVSTCTSLRGLVRQIYWIRQAMPYLHMTPKLKPQLIGWNDLFLVQLVDLTWLNDFCAWYILGECGGMLTVCKVRSLCLSSPSPAVHSQATTSFMVLQGREFWWVSMNLAHWEGLPPFLPCKLQAFIQDFVFRIFTSWIASQSFPSRAPTVL